jgi:hypothetical protein
MTAAQKRCLQLASYTGRIVALPGGYWVDRLPNGFANVTRRDADEHVATVTVQACEARGWLVRVNKRVEGWLDPRDITDAGRAALQAETP